jgi:hypothetical protein
VAHGGALVSKIHSRTKHGDPFARQFTNQILEEVSNPFFRTLQRWIFSGELHDPFNEFFVQVNPDLATDDPSQYAAGDAGFEQGFDLGGGVADSHHIWEKKYVFEKGMVPGFINEDFAKKVSKQAWVTAVADRSRSSPLAAVSTLSATTALTANGSRHRQDLRPELVSYLYR